MDTLGMLPANCLYLLYHFLPKLKLGLAFSLASMITTDSIPTSSDLSWHLKSCTHLTMLSKERSILDAKRAVDEHWRSLDLSMSIW